MIPIQVDLEHLPNMHGDNSALTKLRCCEASLSKLRHLGNSEISVMSSSRLSELNVKAVEGEVERSSIVARTKERKRWDVVDSRKEEERGIYEGTPPRRRDARCHAALG